MLTLGASEALCTAFDALGDMAEVVIIFQTAGAAMGSSVKLYTSASAPMFMPVRPT